VKKSSLINPVWPEFVDPLDKGRLVYRNTKFRSVEGEEYPVVSGIPDFRLPKVLPEKTKTTKEFYDARAVQYEENMHLTFKTHNLDEETTRADFIDLFRFTGSEKILEVGCGTGRDSSIIAERLTSDGELALTDISENMLKICAEKAKTWPANSHLCLANSIYLPYPDRYFDAVYSFGGLGEFPNVGASLIEFVRVTRLGGKIIVGDESMPPWLRDTYFDNVLRKTNPQFAEEVPLKEIPVDARDVKVSWVLGGVFYLIEFTVGDGEPSGNFDFKIPGFRGGTYRTRYEGELEGITKETKEEVINLVRKRNISMHDWLEAAVCAALAQDKEN
jgi:ubiquinone/menaquinone biosynthesis C-methylase UbiE